MALIHYPVVNRNGEIITSAVTNLDLHDIARVGKTYGVKGFYVVTPLSDQKELVGEITSHWIKGAGAEYNPKRREALELIKIKNSLEEVKDDIAAPAEIMPQTVVTCASSNAGSIDYRSFRELLKDGRTYLLLFGTAWGLGREVILEADYILDPIKGVSAYNHLSVRSAAAIILDRLAGREV